MSTANVVLPNNTNLLDAYVVLNAFGGEDGAIVQVKDPAQEPGPLCLLHLIQQLVLPRELMVDTVTFQEL